MGWLRRVGVVLVLCCALAACADEPVGVPTPAIGSRELPAEWLVGGGQDSAASSAQDLRIERVIWGPDDYQKPGVVADDGALWVLRRGELRACPLPGLTYNDGLLRIGADGSVMDVDLKFLDVSRMEDSNSNDCPIVLAGPVAAGDGSVVFVVSSQVDSSLNRTWWRAYRVSADGTVESWEPELPDGYFVVGLGRSAGPEILVVAGALFKNQTVVDHSNHRLFAVDPQTMAVRTIQAPEGSAGAGTNRDPGHIWTRGAAPVGRYDFALLADGRLAFWADSYDAVTGLWVQGYDGLMTRVIDASEAAVAKGEIGVGSSGQPLGAVSALAGRKGWRLEPSSDGRLMLEMWAEDFGGLYTDAFHVDLTGVPADSVAQEIADVSFSAWDGATRPIDSNGWLAVVVLDAQALVGDENSPFAVVSVGRSTHCIWDNDRNAVCSTPRDADTDDSFWMDWVYYRIPVPAQNGTE